MGSENVPGTGTVAAEAGSENKVPGRRGRLPGVLSAEHESVLAEYAGQLARADLSDQARRTYVSRVRTYLVWLEAADVQGEPLTDPAAAAWAARDWKAHQHAVLHRAPSTINASLAAVSDFAFRRGLGTLDGTQVARLEMPARRAPKALTVRDDVRWQRAAQVAPTRDRALAALMRQAGLRIGESVGLDLDDLPSTQRRRRLRIRGKGRKNRVVPVHADLAIVLELWLGERATWPGADTNAAVFLNRAGGRLSVRAADEVIAAITAAAGLQGDVTPHVLRHSFATDLIRAGTDIVTVAELLGHASLDSTRIYTLPTEDDLDAAINRLTIDR